MSGEELRQAIETIEFTDGSSLDESLEEMRRQYNDEEARRKTVENKTAGLLALNAVLIPLILNILEQVSLLPRIILLVLFLSSILLCLFILRGGDYRRPLQRPENIITYAQIDNEEFYLEFLKKYTVAVYHNRKINNRRFKEFNVALVVTFSAIGVVAVLALLPEIL